jgi:acyl-coenzyme A synthetase/AMP-(fatty) acid ligase
MPSTKWFMNGKCNIISNAIDRHANTHPDKVEYIFANEFGSRKVTYRELDHQINNLAAALLDAGINEGDVVGIYLPMISEAFFSIFACSLIEACMPPSFLALARRRCVSDLLIQRQRYYSLLIPSVVEAKRLSLKMNGSGQREEQMWRRSLA